jgi:hypothetical protein
VRKVNLTIKHRTPYWDVVALSKRHEYESSTSHVTDDKNTSPLNFVMYVICDETHHSDDIVLDGLRQQCL